MQAIIQKAKQGDIKAFEILYHAHSSLVYGVCLRISARKDLAEELTQEVFIKAWKKLPQFREESTFATWIYRIAVTTALNGITKEKKYAAPIGPEEGASPIPAELKMDLERELAALPATLRVIVVLHDIEGFSHIEIGKMLNIPVGTSKNRLFQARQILKEALK